MAVGDRTEKRLVGPSVITTSNATVGTVPTGCVWVTKQITFTNTNGLDCWVKFAIGTTATAGNCIFFQLPIAAYDTVVFDTALTLVAAETLQAVSDRGAVNVIVTGWEKEV